MIIFLFGVEMQRHFHPDFMFCVFRRTQIESEAYPKTASAHRLPVPLIPTEKYAFFFKNVLLV